MTVEHITHEREFKILCDALLRFELGPLVQTFATRGADKGIDAEYHGELAGVRGRWVFQFKFLSPAEAPSKQRNTLLARYGPTEGEFARDGVRGADGYVLLTNVPVTVAFVDTLKRRWWKVRKGRPFVAWDPSTLNAMLKGREHLARSWTGAKEARCRTNVIGPLWDWIHNAKWHVEDAVHFPLWPLMLEGTTAHVHQRRFGHSYQNTYGITLRLDDEAFRVATADPQFKYAREIVYPKALAALDSLRAPTARLVSALRAEIDAVRAAILERVPEVAPLEERQRLATALAFALLEMQWGYPESNHGARDGHFLLEGKCTYECPPSTMPALNAMITEYDHGRVPDSVTRARRALAKAVHHTWERLWAPAEFGIDAD